MSFSLKFRLQFVIFCLPGSKKGRPRILKPQDAFILTLMRLRQGFMEEHLADLFGVSVSTVNRLVFLWLDYISIKE